MQIQTSHPIVLIYHGIRSGDADIPPAREPGAAIYDVAQDVFRQQMAWIRDQGVFVSTVAGQTNMEGNRPLILTFDDGEANNFTGAWPVLKELHFPAYFFVTGSRIGQPGYMTWDQLRELQDQGMIVGSHGMHHLILTELEKEDIIKELLDSKRVLEGNLNSHVDSLSIPRGFVNRYIIDQAREAGYRYVFTSQPVAECEMCIGRVAVKAAWSFHRFQQAVYGQIPWQEKAISVFKNLTIKVLGTARYDRWRTRAVGQGSDS